MKTGRLAVLAIVVWLATLAVFGWFFVRGNTAPATSADPRTTVVLNAAERDLVLGEMRGLLAGVQAILAAADAGDRTRLAAAARAVGMASAADVNPLLMAKLPLPFKELGMSVHRDMDALAQAAESGRPLPELQRALTGTLSKCVGCHAAWRFATP